MAISAVYGAHLAMHRLIEEILFGVGGEVDGALGDAGVLGDLLDRGLLEAEAREDADGRTEDALFLRSLHADDQNLNPVNLEVKRETLARQAQTLGNMADMKKGEAPRMDRGGRVAELDRFQACERALAEAFADFAKRTRGGVRWRQLAERHNGHSRLLSARIRELGGVPDTETDGSWIMGPPDSLATLLFAEHMALRGYHDHLIDLDPQSMRLIRDHVLPAHERTLAALVGDADPAMEI